MVEQQNSNVVDFFGFKNRKNANITPCQNIPMKDAAEPTPTAEIEASVERIKASMERFNALLAELRGNLRPR